MPTVETPVGGHGLRGGKDGVEVVHRLAHAHEDHVGQLAVFGDGEELVQYVAGAEVAVEALLAGDAEAAPHLAAHLAADAQRGAVLFGDVYRLDVMPVKHGKQVLLGAVAAHLASHRRLAAYIGHLVEACALGQREVGHGVDALHALFVQPVAELLGGEAWETLGGAELLQLWQGLAK